jgi:hypothetical protein
MTGETLLAELRSSGSALAPLIERASRHGRRWVVVTEAAVMAWERREPTAWAKVQTWLSTERIRMIRVFEA